MSTYILFAYFLNLKFVFVKPHVSLVQSVTGTVAKAAARTVEQLQEHLLANVRALLIRIGCGDILY